MQRDDSDIAFHVPPQDGHCAITFYKDGMCILQYTPSARSPTVMWKVEQDVLWIINPYTLKEDAWFRAAEHFQRAALSYLIDQILLT